MFNNKVEELLEAVNEKSTSIENLINEGKFKEANEATAELEEMQKSLETLQRMHDSVPAPKNPKFTKPVVSKTQDTAEAKFANAARHGFRNAMTESVNSDGGYTVPVDISTRIEKLREAKYSLDKLVRHVSVTTESGERTLRSKKKHKGFYKVGEMGKYKATDQPEYFRQKYEIQKYGGYLPVSLELLDDTDANITGEITEWMADDSGATHNRLILEAIAAGKTITGDDAPTYTVFAGIDDITRTLNVTLGSAYKKTSKIITNDNGFQALCELKDSNQRPLMNPNPADPTKMQLAVGPLVVPIEVVPNDELEDVTVDGKQYPPFYIGDFFEGIVMYDRKKFSIKSSDVASVDGLSAFGEDCLLFKGTERLDVRYRDVDAYCIGYLSIETRTLTKKKITPAA